MQIREDAKFQWNPRVASRTLDDTAFVLFDSRMVSLNEVGTYIWETYKHPHTTTEVTGGVVGEFETTSEQARQDTLEFTNALLKKSLLILVNE
ncbi:MAG: PqqD family protein [Myxococcota bacterium]|nr:PqqD family protein [Myxococcota bacterium]